MLADDIAKAKQRDAIAAFDAGERAVAESLGDLIVAPELEPSDGELLAPWLAFCKDRSCRHAPAKPWVCAAYALERHKQSIDVERMVTELHAITRLHSKFGLADPVTGPVHLAVERIAKIKPPRSWPPEDKALFATLPALIRYRIETREQQRDTELRRRQNEYAEKLNALKPNDEPKEAVATEKEEV
jgi:hypothetical protein